MKKTLKKILSTLLCLVIALSFTTVAAFAAEEKPFYLVLGDSIAYGSGLANPTQACYGKIVADTNGFEYVNQSVPGHTTTKLINVLSRDEVIENVAKADIISISIGGNDFLTSNLVGLMFDAIVKSDYSEFDAIAESFYGNFTTIIDKINEINTDAVILMQTLYNPQSDLLRAPYQQGADRINAAIAKYDSEHPGEIVIVDVASALSDTMDNFAGDEIHPSAMGNEKIALAVNAKLAEIGMGTGNELVIATKGEDFKIPASFGYMLDIMSMTFKALSVFYNLFNKLFGFVGNIFA